MKRVVFVCVLALFLCSAAGCGRQESSGNQEKKTAEIFAMDTIMDLTVYGEHAEEALQDARALIQKYERLFSVNIETSDVAKLNRAEGEPVEISDETYELIQAGCAMSEETEGLFDISVYPLVRAWGFTTENYRVPDEEERAKLKKCIDYRKIKLPQKNQALIPKGMQIDLGGIAKGYLSQKLVELFAEKQVSAAIISLGGNVQTYGEKPDQSPFQIGITDPADGTGLIGRIEVAQKAVVTSGSYQRYFEQDGKRYHHIMDTRTGAPAETDLTGVTVVADSGTEADALATALFVMGKQKAVTYSKQHPEIEVILVDTDHQVWTSEGITLLQ